MQSSRIHGVSIDIANVAETTASSESSTNVDLHAGKIMHNTSLRRRRATAVVGIGHPRGCSLCSHKFAIMQMPRSSRVRRLTFGSLLYSTGAIVNAMVVVENATRCVPRGRERKREKAREDIRSAFRYYRSASCRP